jgi:hypothetical protein
VNATGDPTSFRSQIYVVEAEADAEIEHHHHGSLEVVNFNVSEAHTTAIHIVLVDDPVSTIMARSDEVQNDLEANLGVAPHDTAAAGATATATADVSGALTTNVIEPESSAIDDIPPHYACAI